MLGATGTPSRVIAVTVTAPSATRLIWHASDPLLATLNVSRTGSPGPNVDFAALAVKPTPGGAACAATGRPATSASAPAPATISIRPQRPTPPTTIHAR